MFPRNTIRALASLLSLWLAASSLSACGKKKSTGSQEQKKPGMEVTPVDAAPPTMDATSPAAMADDMGTDEMGTDEPVVADDPTIPKDGEAKARLLLVPWKDCEGAGEDVKASKAEAKATADKIRADIKEEIPEAEFGKLVKKYSYGPTKENGGVVGPVLPADVEGHFKTIFTLKKGQISAVVEAPSGFHIFMRTK
jgi:hypothetical protein